MKVFLILGPGIVPGAASGGKPGKTPAGKAMASGQTAGNVNARTPAAASRPAGWNCPPARAPTTATAPEGGKKEWIPLAIGWAVKSPAISPPLRARGCFSHEKPAAWLDLDQAMRNKCLPFDPFRGNIRNSQLLFFE